MTKQFQRNKEDFVCENCSAKVSGTGYTNHCPKCLWSKHVDVNPGDRNAICSGMMKPVGIAKKSDKLTLIHRCLRCHLQKKNKVEKNDNFDIILTLSAGR